jgi:hypothetical protein
MRLQPRSLINAIAPQGLDRSDHGLDWNELRRARSARGLALVRRFRGKADFNQPTTLVESVENDPKRTRQMIRPADGVVFDYVVPIFNMVTSTAKDSNGA